MEMIRKEIAVNLYLSLRALVERMEDYHAPNGIPVSLASPATDAWNALRYAEEHGLEIPGITV